MQNRHYILHTVTIVNLAVIVPSTTCSAMASRFSLSSHTTPLHRSQCKPTRPCNLEKHSSMTFVSCQIEETFCLFCLHKALNVWRLRFFSQWILKLKWNCPRKPQKENLSPEIFLWSISSERHLVFYKPRLDKSIIFLFRTALQRETPIHCTLPATAAPFSPSPSKDGKALPKM